MFFWGFFFGGGGGAPVCTSVKCLFEVGSVRACVKARGTRNTEPRNAFGGSGLKVTLKSRVCVCCVCVCVCCVCVCVCVCVCRGPAPVSAEPEEGVCACQCQITECVGQLWVHSHRSPTSSRQVPWSSTPLCAEAVSQGPSSRCWKSVVLTDESAETGSAFDSGWFVVDVKISSCLRKKKPAESE